MTVMTMPPMGRRWPKVQELIDSIGLTIVSVTHTDQQTVVEFQEDLNVGQKTQFEAKLVHTVSGIDWA